MEKILGEKMLKKKKKKKLIRNILKFILKAMDTTKMVQSCFHKYPLIISNNQVEVNYIRETVSHL